jgi:hypothetical protein
VPARRLGGVARAAGGGRLTGLRPSHILKSFHLFLGMARPRWWDVPTPGPLMPTSSSIQVRSRGRTDAAGVDDHSTADDPEQVARGPRGGRVSFFRQPARWPVGTSTHASAAAARASAAMTPCAIVLSALGAAFPHPASCGVLPIHHHDESDIGRHRPLMALAARLPNWLGNIAATAPAWPPSIIVRRDVTNGWAGSRPRIQSCRLGDVDEDRRALPRLVRA